MELTPEQERAVRRIMGGMDCPMGFRCYEEQFESLCRAQVYKGANVVQCQSVDQWNCPMSYAFCGDIHFCRCRLRRYVALELGK